MSAAPECVICGGEARATCGYCEGAVCSEHYEKGVCTDCGGTGRSPKKSTRLNPAKPSSSPNLVFFGRSERLEVFAAIFFGLFLSFLALGFLSTAWDALLNANIYFVMLLVLGLMMSLTAFACFRYLWILKR